MAAYPDSSRTRKQWSNYCTMIPDRRIPDVFADVAKFTELAQPNMLVPVGETINPKAIELAIKLFEEEGIKEYLSALRKFAEHQTKENLVAVIDGGLDTIYVIAWAFRVMNVTAHAYWNEVQRSNMAKFPRVNGSAQEMFTLDIPEYKDIEIEINERNAHWVITNAQTGKVVKPRGWTPPDLFGVMLGLENIRRLRTQPDGIANGFLQEYFHTQEERIENDSTGIW